MFKKISKHLVITLSIIVMAFFNIFAPYYITFIFPSSNKMIIGVDYYIDSEVAIAEDLEAMNIVGIKVIKIELLCEPNSLTDYTNNRTKVFFEQISFYDFKIAVKVMREDVWKLGYYLEHWGDKIDYIQVLNEPELIQGFGEGALLLDDEIFTPVRQIISNVTAYNVANNGNISMYTNFSPAFLLRTNIVQFYSNFTEIKFLGFDVYMDIGIQTTPFIDLALRRLSGRETIVTEFGISTLDENKKTEFVISGLNFFKAYGYKQCWLLYWNGQEYEISGTKLEVALKEWIKDNGA